MATNARMDQARKYAYVKQRIASVQGKAKGVGFLYLIAILAITALALVFSLVSVEKAGLSVKLTVMKFWEIFKTAKGAYKANALHLAVAGIYGLMAFILVINVLRAFGKLGWLFKRKASRLYGFNRNMYAMDDLGNIFSGSFASVIVCHFIIALLATSVKAVKIEMFAYVVLGVGLFFHFIGGVLAGRVSLFETENGITELRREAGMGGAILRNIIQLAVAVAVGYFLLNFSQIRQTVDKIIDAPKVAFKDWKALLVPAVQLVLLIWTIGLVTYATGTTEYDLEGAQASGRKGFLVWSLLTLLTAGGAFAYFKFVAKTTVSNNLLIIAIIALVAVLFELILIKLPLVKHRKESDEVDTTEYVKQTYVDVDYNKPGVYLVQPPMQNPVPQPYGYPYGYGFESTNAKKR